MKKVVFSSGPDYAKRGYHYVKNYGVPKLYRKARERLSRDALERDYQEWMLAERPADSEKELQREHHFPWEPLISIVVPTYCPEEVFLREMIESVLKQTYGKLELCIADGGGETDFTEQIIRGYMKQDDRIRYRKLPENLGISGNTNEAVAMAEGDFLAFLDHDDLLEEHALFEIVRWLQEHPSAELIYTDEDKVAADSGMFFHPHLKPDFNLELLRSNNYICHFLVVRRELLQRVGFFRPEYDGAQDYDLVLRCAEQTGEIGHVPRVLYHWRSHRASTSADPSCKDYTRLAGRHALEAHLERMGLAAQVEDLDDPGFYRVSYELQSVPKVCVVLLDVPNLNTLKRFVKAIQANRTYANFEILALIDASEKNKLIGNFVKEHRQTPIKVVYCTSACNKFVTFSRLAEKLDSEYLLFLESRTERISRGFLETFLGNAERPEVGAVGGRVYDSAGRLKCGAKVLGLDGLAGDAFAGLRMGYTGYFHKTILRQNFHAVSGEAMMVRREYFLKAGGFSEDVEDRMKDVDLCLKLERMGLQNVYEPGVLLIEQKYRTRKRKAARPAAAFEKKWKELLLEPDKYYNENLSLEAHDFRVREFR